MKADRAPSDRCKSRPGSRREFLAVVALLPLLPVRTSGAGPEARVRRIAFINPQPGDAEAFLERMGELGVSAPRNLEMRLFPVPSYRDLEGHVRPAIAWNPDLVVVAGSDILRVRRAVPRSLPVVFTRSGDPVLGGFVESLARPGGNMTGVTGSLEKGKSLEYACMLVPGKRRFVALFDSSSLPEDQRHLPFKLHGAEELKVDVTGMDVGRLPGGAQAALDSVRPRSFDALLFIGFHSPAAHAPVSAYVGFQRRTHIPCVMQVEQSAEQGAVMSRGADFREQHRLAAEQAARILRGARAGELPVLRVTRARVVINRRAATEIGLKVPQDLLLLADRVID